MRARPILALVILMIVLAGCRVQPTPTPTPIPSPTPTNTPIPPTLTPSPTPTATATATATPTGTLTPTPTAIPTYTPTPQPLPTATPRPVVKVEYRDLHYECQQNKDWTRGLPPYGTTRGYRSLQVAMIVTNLDDKPIQPPWMPSRWILTDGVSQVIETYSWQWVYARDPRFFPQPVIQLGEMQGWTWLVYPIEKGWWVAAIEWDYEGKTYRQDLPKPNIVFGDFNYVDCESQH